MRKGIFLVFLAMVVFAFCQAIAQETQPCEPGTSPQVEKKDFTSAKDLVQAMAGKAENIKDYTLNIYYVGKEGTYVFEYRCVRPNNIRTRIAQGPNARTTLLYLPQEKEDQMKAKKGMFKKWIPTDKYKETPLVQSLLDQFLKELQQYPEGKILGKDTVTISVGKEVTLDTKNGTVTLEPYVAQTSPSPSPTPESQGSTDSTPASTDSPEASASPGASPAASATGEESPEPATDNAKDCTKCTRECIIVQFEKDNIKDIIAVDAETLWVVFRKKMVDGKIDQEAATWDIKENTNPEISF